MILKLFFTQKFSILSMQYILFLISDKMGFLFIFIYQNLKREKGYFVKYEKIIKLIFKFQPEHLQYDLIILFNHLLIHNFEEDTTVKIQLE